MKDGLTLRIITVSSKSEDIFCDCVLLPIAEDSKGRFSGSYGIRQGHAGAVFALSEGSVTAKSEDKAVFSAYISGGFATVENNIVTLTADKVETK